LLQRDIEILNSYIALEKIRYQSRLSIMFNVHGLVQHERIPPLLLFPLVENAFKEGLSETVDDPWININLAVDAGRLKLKIEHSLPKLKSLNHAESFQQNGFKQLIKKLETQFSGGYKLYMHQEEEISVTEMELDLARRY
jgi:LytS/YehU family sensor histidine kinase